MQDIVYLNGDFLAADEARVSVFDRGFLFGDGIYEVIPVVNRVLIDQEYFLERLSNSTREIDLGWPCDASRLLEVVRELVERNQLLEGYVYLQITRGAAPRDFEYPAGVTPTLMAFTRNSAILAHPMAERGVSVAIVEDLRWKRRDIKSLNLLAQCMAKQRARMSGAYEGWMVDEGFVTEGASSSAFIVSNGKLITRPLSNSILPGIRRRVILELIEEQQLTVELRTFTVEEALEADEAFLSSATTLVLPIISIDGNKVGNGSPGPVTRSVRELYLQLVKATAGLS
ncbi:MAG: D-amino-acid transaminase [Gammaproteobacteria bacterium]|nr:D-amino-acid transaminase [Pseudomonadales bacterium]MCP5348502.1 D-amino-acid transaminase [Pseudomonadales bacterium]